MQLLTYVSLIGLLLNAYFLLLPAMGVKKHIHRIAFIPALLVIAFIQPLILLTLFPAIFLGNVFYFINSIFKLPKWLKISILIFSSLLLPFAGFLTFACLLGGDMAYYYFSFPFSLFWIHWIWIAIRKEPQILKHIWRFRISFILLAILFPLSIWGYRHNPTTFGRSLYIYFNEDTHLYLGRKILNLFKLVQQVIVLELDNEYEDIDSVQFTSIRRIYGGPDYFDDNEFSIDLIVNGNIPFGTNITLEDDKIRFTGVYSNDDDKLKRRKDSKGSEVELDDLANPKNQERLKKIDITYYLKNDIFRFNY